MDWLDLFAVQGTLKSLLQHHRSKASILRCSAFFTVQLSHPYTTTGKTIALTRRVSLTQQTWVLANSERQWRTGEAWPAAVHGVAKSRTWQSNWTTTTYSEHRLRYFIYFLPWKSSRVCKSLSSYFIHRQLKALRHWIVSSFSFLIFSRVKKQQAVLKSTGLKVKRPRSQFWVCHMISKLVWANYLHDTL